MLNNKKTIIACCVTFAAAVIITVGAMKIFDVGIGDKTFVSRTDYEHMKAVAERYEGLDELYNFLEDNFYTDLDEESIMSSLYKGLFAGAGDPYTRYMTKDEYEALKKSYANQFEGVGISLSASREGYIEVIAVTDDSPAQKAGIREKDRIIAVDDVRYTGSEIQNAVDKVRGEAGTSVKITVSRGETILDFNIVRAPVSGMSVYSKDIGENIGYIRISSFRETTAEQFAEELSKQEAKNVAGLVIDLRSNGGGLVDQSVAVADMLMDEGVIVYSENGKGERTYYRATDGKTKLPYAILVNGGSASATEILVAGVKASGEGTVIGTQTYGKGIIQKTWERPKGEGLEVTVAQYFAPDGSVIHGKGVTPDIILNVQESDIVNGVIVNDRQLQRAVQILKNKAA